MKNRLEREPLKTGQLAIWVKSRRSGEGLNYNTGVVGKRRSGLEVLRMQNLRVAD